MPGGMGGSDDPCWNTFDTKTLQESASKLHRMLYEACSLLDKNGLTMSLSAETCKWWEVRLIEAALEKQKLKEAENQRKKDKKAADRQAKLIAGAIAKLTPEEREILGI